MDLKKPEPKDDAGDEQQDQATGDINAPLEIGKLIVIDLWMLEMT